MFLSYFCGRPYFCGSFRVLGLQLNRLYVDALLDGERGEAFSRATKDFVSARIVSSRFRFVTVKTFLVFFKHWHPINPYLLVQSIRFSQQKFGKATNDHVQKFRLPKSFRWRKKSGENVKTTFLPHLPAVFIIFDSQLFHTYWSNEAALCTSICPKVILTMFKVSGELKSLQRKTGEIKWEQLYFQSGRRILSLFTWLF